MLAMREGPSREVRLRLNGVFSRFLRHSDEVGIQSLSISQTFRRPSRRYDLRRVSVLIPKSRVNGGYMSDKLSDEGFDLLFREARTHSHWLDKPVSDDTLNELYDLMKWAPTSMNCCPARFLFVRTKEAKKRLSPALASGNVEKTMSAPVTVIIGHDFRFYEHLPKLFPPNPSARDMFANSPQIAELTAKRNGTLQGAYLILAARALGLDCGPMSGFDNAKVDQEFFACGSELDPAEQEFFTVGHFRSNFLCNLGYAERSKVHPRNPRLDFDEACKIL